MIYAESGSVDARFHALFSELTPYLAKGVSAGTRSMARGQRNALIVQAYQAGMYSQTIANSALLSVTQVNKIIRDSL